MTDVTFADLVEIYRATRFDGDGDGVLSVRTERILRTLRGIEGNEQLYRDAQIAVEGDADPVVGGEVRISVGPPNMKKMGRLMPSFEALFQSPDAQFVEPSRYYVIDHAYAAGDEPAPEILTRYRAMLVVMSILREAATLIDDTMGELVFVGTEKVVVTVRVEQADLGGDIGAQAVRLRRLFADGLHLDEKRTILVETLIGMVSSLRSAGRFRFIVRNLDRLADEVEKGYRLFTSSFSYSKIRNDVETARIDFVGKIHKTIVDIQGQLLGIPVATVVVVSQLKHVTGCDMTFWTNLGVLVGAWIFVGMLSIAGINQWKTLQVIGHEVERQRNRLTDEFASVADQFLDVFKDLDDRVEWHRRALICIAAVLTLGAISTTIAFLKLAPAGSSSCLAIW